MSTIGYLEEFSEYVPRSFEDKQEEINAARSQPESHVQAPLQQAQHDQQAEKDAIQGHVYTGKGSFIDKVF